MLACSEQAFAYQGRIRAEDQALQVLDLCRAPYPSMQPGPSSSCLPEYLSLQNIRLVSISACVRQWNKVPIQNVQLMMTCKSDKDLPRPFDTEIFCGEKPGFAIRFPLKNLESWCIQAPCQ